MAEGKIQKKQKIFDPKTITKGKKVKVRLLQPAALVPVPDGWDLVDLKVPATDHFNNKGKRIGCMIGTLTAYYQRSSDGLKMEAKLTDLDVLVRDHDFADDDTVDRLRLNSEGPWPSATSVEPEEGELEQLRENMVPSKPDDVDEGYVVTEHDGKVGDDDE